MASLEEQKRQVERGIALLTFKEVNGTLTTAERELLRGLRKELGAINAKLSAPRRPKPVLEKGARSQARAGGGGVTRVVSGGSAGERETGRDRGGIGRRPPRSHVYSLPNTSQRDLASEGRTGGVAGNPHRGVRRAPLGELVIEKRCKRRAQP